MAVGALAMVLVAAGCGAKDEALEAAKARSAGGQLVQAGARPTQGARAGTGVVGEELTETDPAGVAVGDPLSPSSDGDLPASGEPGGSVDTTAAATGDTPTGTGSAVSGDGSAPPVASASGPTIGVSDTEVRFGLHLPETIGGINVNAITKLPQLSESFWRYTNEVKGGVHGRQVKVIMADDGYEVAKALQACRDLIAQKVFFISGTGGADQIVACGQYAVKEGYTYTSLGVSEAGLVGNPNYFAFTITYDKQGPLMARYIVRKLDGKQKKVAMVRFNSPNADGGHKAFVAEYKRLAGKGLVVDDAVDKQGNQSELTSECIKLQQAGAEIVTLLAAPTVTGQLAQACLAQNYRPQWVAWANTLGCTVEPPFGGPGMDGCLSFQISHHPSAVDVPIEKECRDAWTKYQGDSEFPAGGETYCALFDFYRQALLDGGRELTKESFQAALRRMNYDNGLANPIAMRPDQIASTAVAVWQSDADTQSDKEVLGFATDF